MHCIQCGTALPPAIATCPACGASTPYNVTASSPTAETSWQQSSEPQPPPEQDDYQPETLPQPVSAPTWSQLPPAQQAAEPPSPPPAAPAPAVQQPSPQPPSIKRGATPLARALLLAIIAILIIGGSGLIYYVAVGRPAEFRAQATAIAQTLLTTTSPQGIYTNATSGKPVINDPLSSSSKSSWSEISKVGSKCTFTSGAYHLSTSGDNLETLCFSNTNNLSDFAFQVQMTITQGPSGGITFRVDTTQSNYYLFFIRRDGVYGLQVRSDTGLPKVLSYGPSSAINTGLNQPNLLTVIAHGSNLYLYINKQYVVTASDSTYRSGGIGLSGFRGLDPSGDVAFSHAELWKLS